MRRSCSTASAACWRPAWNGVDGGLDEGRRDAISGPLTLAVINQAGTVGGDVGLVNSPMAVRNLRMFG
ncbi:exported hypothetical protein [Mesorhizobium sp. STM 4661]|nr:exported hypothetical protein [Mesorhizobium sp. STM 4661]